ncbi:MAG TPA: hypothetical protein VJ992_11420 [Gemmatimonadales bacterium]|nr:hypothetical protein [Gemmatimonadales bacterium]
MTRIDLRDVLKRTVSGVYGDLVTRRTGQAVRDGIEELLADVDGEQVAVIDFGTVRVLDMSCADEIVGKLLLTSGAARYFALVNLHEGHLDAIEPVLERHGLAVVAQTADGAVRVLGSLPDAARRAFGVMLSDGPAPADEIARRLAVTRDAARAAVDELLRLRLVLPDAGGYQPLRCA